jgi:antitoxin ParD1/3/4
MKKCSFEDKRSGTRSQLGGGQTADVDKNCHNLHVRCSSMEDIMPTMNVSLPAELADFVEQEVASGDYGTASEVVRESLRMLKREKAARDEKLTILRREVGIGLAQAKEGRLSKQSISDIAESLRNGSSK